MTHRICARSVLVLACLLAACAPRQDGRVAEAVKLFDTTYETLRGSRGLIAREIRVIEPDFRGRTPRDDIEQWIFGPAFEADIGALRQKASAAMTLDEARRHLDEASELIKKEAVRSDALRDYWRRYLPAPYWRNYWDGFFTENGVAVREPDANLLALESQMRAALDTGDFATANGHAKTLVETLRAALDRLNDEVGRRREKGPFKLQARRSPCVPGAPPDPSRVGPKVVKGETLESVYPRKSVNRGEEGVVTMLIELDARGCGRRVAIVVRSGVAALDAAALQWFETARFSAAVTNGKPIKSRLKFKLRFAIKD